MILVEIVTDSLETIHNMSSKFAKVGKSEQKTINSIINALESLGIDGATSLAFIDTQLNKHNGATQSLNFNTQGDDPNFKKFLKSNFIPLYVSLDLGARDSDALNRMLESELGEAYKIYGESKCSKECPGHVTVAFNNTFNTLKEYSAFVKANYKQGQKIEVTVVGYAMNTSCVAFMVKLPDGVGYHPEDKNLHVTALLNDVKPVYSNELLEKLKSGDGDGKIVKFSEPIVVTSKVEFKGKLRKWTKK